MKGVCIVCGRPAESNYCFLHKPHKPIGKKKKKNNTKEETIQMHNFFLTLFNKRVHRCQNCGAWLGNEARSYMFDHILEKEKYPELKFEEENIMFLCLECHDKKTQGHYSEYMIQKREEIIDKFDK